MTERHAGYVVTLAEDTREDDAEHIINALRMIRGVLSVEPVHAGTDVSIATERAKAEMRAGLLSLLKEL
jgi:hypothetical protein